MDNSIGSQSKVFRKDLYDPIRTVIANTSLAYNERDEQIFTICVEMYEPVNPDNRYYRGRLLTHSSGALLTLTDCLYDEGEIAVLFPELADVVKWHLCTTKGPINYEENTIFYAGDRDCNGRRAGEPCQWDYVITFNGNPIKHVLRRKFWEFLKERAPNFDLTIVAVQHPKYSTMYTFQEYTTNWTACPFDTEWQARDFLEALQHHHPEFSTIVTDVSKGKERMFNLARDAAIWPDATDEQLSAEPEELRKMLRARLPKLIEDFKADMTKFGFVVKP